jgi:hypothetical protein
MDYDVALTLSEEDIKALEKESAQEDARGLIWGMGNQSMT